MMTLALTLVIFLGAVLLLAGIAVVTGRVLKGSCGGVANQSCLCADEGLAKGSCDTEAQDLVQIDSGVVVGASQQ